MGFFNRIFFRNSDQIEEKRGEFDNAIKKEVHSQFEISGKQDAELVFQYYIDQQKISEKKNQQEQMELQGEKVADSLYEEKTKRQRRQQEELVNQEQMELQRRLEIEQRFQEQVRLDKIRRYEQNIGGYIVNETLFYHKVYGLGVFIKFDPKKEFILVKFKNRTEGVKFSYPDAIDKYLFIQTPDKHVKSEAFLENPGNERKDIKEKQFFANVPGVADITSENEQNKEPLIDCGHNDFSDTREMGTTFSGNQINEMWNDHSTKNSFNDMDDNKARRYVIFEDLQEKKFPSENKYNDQLEDRIDNTGLRYSGKNICIRLNDNFNIREKRNKILISEDLLCKKFSKIKDIKPKDRLQFIIDVVFREGFNKQIYVRNLTFTNINGNDVKVLAIRPEICEGDFLCEILPKGTSLLFKGHVAGREFVIDLIHETTDTEQLDFEVSCNATPYRNPEMVRENFLYDLIKTAKSLTEYTGEKLEEWKEYLQWEKNLASCQIYGCKYYKVTFDEEQLKLVFWLVCESKECLQAFKKYLGRNIQVFDNEYSIDKWRFKFSGESRKHRYNSLEVGRYRGILDEYYLRKTNEQVQHICTDNVEYVYLEASDYSCKENCVCDEKDAFEDDDKSDVYRVFSNPYIAKVKYDLNRADMDEINQKGLVGNELVDYVYDNVLSNYYSNGFLALSAIGEFVLINRFEQAIKQLERDECYSPNLAMWLFNVERARTPKNIQHMQIDKWLNKGVSNNKNQKTAVHKMLAAPDLCLIQGPPGTGKTTVIAEAIYQFVRTGNRVLIASQSNDAVDNALERLADSPEIRAIRLGQKSRRKRTQEDSSTQKFAEDKALKYYYNALVIQLNVNWFSVWEKQEKDIASFDKDIQDATCRSQDLSKLVKKHEAQNRELTDLREKYERCKKSLEDALNHNVNLQNEAQKHLTFKSMVSGGIEDKFYLSKTLLLILETELNPVIKKAISCGVYLTQGELSVDVMGLSNENAYLFIAIKNVISLGGLRERIAKSQMGTNENEGSIKLFSNELQEVKNKIAECVMAGDDDGVIRYKDEANSFQIELDRLQFSSSSVEITPIEKQILSNEFVASLDDKNYAIHKLQEIENDWNMAISKAISAIDTYLSTKEKMNIADLEEEIEVVEEQFICARECVDSLNRQIQDKQSFVEIIREKYSIESQNIEEIIEYIKSLKALNLKELDAQKEFRNDWEGLLRGFCERLKDEDAFKYDKEYYQDIYVNACNVVGISCTDNMRNLTDNGYDDFDVVIIDEVSKATPPELLIPLMKARKAILVGDHRQLPPMFKEHEGSYKELTKIRDSLPQEIGDLMTDENYNRFKKMVTSSLFKDYFEAADDSIKHSLLVQYRMHSDIMAIINRFYEQRLTAGLSRDQEEKDKYHGLTIKGVDGGLLITPKNHAYWIDSSFLPNGKPIIESFINNSTSACNVLEKYMIIELLKKIADSYKAEGYSNDNKKTIGIISFYQMQVNELRDLFKAERKKYDFSSIDVDINTVDRFQGKEKNIIITSLVRNNKDAKASQHVVAFERINVAFSRAQELLIIVGAKHMYENSKVELPNMNMPGYKTTPVYKNIMEDLNRKACFKNSSYLITPKLEEIISAEYIKNGGKL